MAHAEPRAALPAKTQPWKLAEARAYFAALCRDGRPPLSRIEIANEIDVSTSHLDTLINCLVREAGLRIEKQHHRRRYVLPGAGASGWAAMGPDYLRAGHTIRACMCCAKPFASEGRFNRLCDTCR
jgi:hypothetical protein